MSKQGWGVLGPKYELVPKVVVDQKKTSTGEKVEIRIRIQIFWTLRIGETGYFTARQTATARAGYFTARNLKKREKKTFVRNDSRE